MNEHLVNFSQGNDLLKQLQFCAHHLLLAYDKTLLSDLWIAFEKTVGVCEALTYRHHPDSPMTLH